jgi:hypothetical protein
MSLFKRGSVSLPAWGRPSFGAHRSPRSFGVASPALGHRERRHRLPHLPPHPSDAWRLHRDRLARIVRRSSFRTSCRSRSSPPTRAHDAAVSLRSPTRAACPPRILPCASLSNASLRTFVLGGELWCGFIFPRSPLFPLVSPSFFPLPPSSLTFPPRLPRPHPNLFAPLVVCEGLGELARVFALRLDREKVAAAAAAATGERARRFVARVLSAPGRAAGRTRGRLR